MMKTEWERVRKQFAGKRVGGELVSTLKLSVSWGFIATLVIRGLVARVWTVIPTREQGGDVDESG